MTSKPLQEVYDLVRAFNRNGDLELLIPVFESDQLPIEDVLDTVNNCINEEWLSKLRFSVLRFDPDFLIYGKEDGRVAIAYTDPGSLYEVLREIKRYDNKSPNNVTTQNIKTAILVAGKGSIKSYDVFTSVSTSLMSIKEIKQAILDREVWSKERRRLHDKVISDGLKNARSMSTYLKKSKQLERGLYCIRGSVASGKSTFIQNLLENDKNAPKDVIKGVLSTDAIKRVLIRNTENIIGSNLAGYAFHDEASMLSKKLLELVKSKGLLYIVDKRMQDAQDLKGLLDDAAKRKLPLILFDLKVDFVTSALRVLKRRGVYPSDPTPDFTGLLKSFKHIEEGRRSFFEEAMRNPIVKEYHFIVSSDTDKPNSVLLKHNFEATDQGELALLVDSSEVVDQKALAELLLPYGETLKDALDDHSRKVYEDAYDESVYQSHFLRNIENTSRTYGGELNTSASPDKKAKLNGGLSQESVSSYSRRNLSQAFDYISNNRNILLYDASTVKRLVNKVARIVNADIISDERFLIRKGENSQKYNYVDARYVDGFYDTFIKKLYSRLLDVNYDPIDTAAWIEWNIDFCGHIFSDGCGRVAKVMSAWSLMRKNRELPDYANGLDGYGSIRESYRKRFAIKKKVKYTSPTEDEDYVNFLGYYRKLFTSELAPKKVLAAGGLVYNSAGQFLILQTTKAKDKGKWVIPGGKIEAHENEIDAFKREVFEETGLDIRNTQLLGTREYVSRRGNPYQLFDYTSTVLDYAAVKINNESSAYAWISVEQISDYQFPESIRHFLNTYFINNRLDYYKSTEVINLDDLDVPNFHEHTMAASLGSYVESKLPVKELEEYLPFIKRLEVHSVYPDIATISGLDLGFRIIKVISASSPKDYSSNSVRPTFLLVERQLEKFIVCCTTPGTDLLLHYTSMIAHLLKKYPHITLSAAHYPSAERQIDTWTNLNHEIVHPDDIVILGYGTFLKSSLSNDVLFSVTSTVSNDFYTSTRFRYGLNSDIVVNCLEANFSYWGNLSHYLSNKICRLGAKEVIHVGKVGTLRAPSEVLERIYIPSGFAIGRRQEAVQLVENIGNSLAYFEKHLSSVHVSVSTTMEETFTQRNHFEDAKIDTIDIESSKMAQGIALYNLNAEMKVAFGSIHFASDYVRKKEDRKRIFEFDLSTKRSPMAQDKKNKILAEIFITIRTHLLNVADGSTIHNTALEPDSIRS
jgi:8-oxo-dGTP diphosphatase